MLHEGSTSDRRFIFWESYIKLLEGKLLTIIDASFPESSQQKAVKDLIRQSVWKWAEETTWCDNCENGRKIDKLKLRTTNKSEGFVDGLEQYCCENCNMFYDK